MALVQYHHLSMTFTSSDKIQIIKFIKKELIEVKEVFSSWKSSNNCRVIGKWLNVRGGEGESQEN